MKVFFFLSKSIKINDAASSPDLNPTEKLIAGIQFVVILVM